MADFFISYNKADKAWAEWIAWQLEHAGYTVIVEVWDFRPGSNCILEMQKATSETERTLAVLSPDFLQATYTQPEWAAAFHKDPTGADRTLVPVRVRQCQPKGLLAAIVTIGLVGLDEAGARIALLEGVRREGVRPTSPPPVPRPPPPAVTRGPPPPPPPPHPHASLGDLFKGRDAFLQQIREGFAGTPGRAQAIVARKAIHGLGGIGKTRAAVEYAWRFAEEYAAILFAGAASPADFRAGLAGLCVPLGLAAGVTDDTARAAAALDWLRSPRPQPWLLIVDNVDTLEAAAEVESSVRALAGGHVLITGRLDEWPPYIEAHRMDVLDPDAATDFLLARTAGKRQEKPDDSAQARLLAGDLDGLALALETAAGFIRHRRLSLADYRRRWREADAQVLHWHDARTMQYDRPLATTWQTTVDLLPPAARALLNILCWLAPDPLPRFLFDAEAAPEGLRPLFEHPEAPSRILGRLSDRRRLRLRAAAADPEAALAALRDYSLLQPAPSAEFPSEGQLHRVLALITRERQSEQEQARFLLAALALLSAAGMGSPGDVRHWPVWDPLCPHVQDAVVLADQRGIPEPTAMLMGLVGVLLDAKARHAEAELLERRALAIAEDTYGPEHPNVATEMNNLAVSLLSTNRLREAEPLMRRALAIDEASYGPDHPTVARDLNNLAQLLRGTNRLGGAEPLARRALAIDEAGYGPEHPNVARSLNNLAQLLQDTDRLCEAEPLMRRALAIDEASYGAEHPSVAIRLNNLAQLLKATNRLECAEPLMWRALAIDEAIYGLKHPDVAIDLNNLARLLQARKRFGDAEPLIRRALAIDEASYGSEHPNVAIRLHNLAQLLQDTNRLCEAEPLMRRALVVFLAFTRNTGHQHPHLRIVFRNYRVLLAAMRTGPAEYTQRIQSLGTEAGFDAEGFRRLLAELRE